MGVVLLEDCVTVVEVGCQDASVAIVSQIKADYGNVFRVVVFQQSSSPSKNIGWDPHNFMFSSMVSNL